MNAQYKKKTKKKHYKHWHTRTPSSQYKCSQRNKDAQNKLYDMHANNQ